MLNKLRKILATIALIAMLVSLDNPIFAVSSTGTGMWVAGQYASGIMTTDSVSERGIIIRRLSNNITKERITVFCAEFGVDSTTGIVETAEHIIPTDPVLKKACKIAYFGWYSRYGQYAVDGGMLTEEFKQVKIDYVFTQQMIWETLGQNKATFIDSNIQNQYLSFKNQINSNINNMQKKPSFSETIITINIGNTITLTDTNGVLAEYTSIDKTIEGIRVVHNKGENTMSITVNKDCTLENYTISEEIMKSWGLIKEESKDNDTTIFFSFRDGVQNQLYSMHYNEPVSMSMNLQINHFGKLELNKLDENGNLIDGAIFEVNGPDNFSKEVAVTNGKITLDNLKKGIYTIKEKTAPQGYLLDSNTYTVEVVTNQTTKHAIINEKPIGTLIVNKNIIQREDIDTTLVDISDFSGIQFKLTAKEDIINVIDGSVIYKKEQEVGAYNLDQNGKLKVENLPMGVYELQEVKTLDGLILDTNKYEVKFVQNDEFTKVYKENIVIENYATIVEFSKKDITGEKQLEGTKLKLVDKEGNVIDSWISNNKNHIIEGLIAGQEYTLIEIESPEGYEIAEPITFKVEADKETQLIELRDKPIVKEVNDEPRLNIQTGNEMNYRLLIYNIAFSGLGIFLISKKLSF